MNTKEKQLVLKSLCAKNDFIALLLSAKGLLAVFIINAPDGGRILLGRFADIGDDCKMVCYEDFQKQKIVLIPFDRLEAFGILCVLPDSD